MRHSGLPVSVVLQPSQSEVVIPKPTRSGASKLVPETLKFHRTQAFPQALNAHSCARPKAALPTAFRQPTTPWNLSAALSRAAPHSSTLSSKLLAKPQSAPWLLGCSTEAAGFMQQMNPGARPRCPTSVSADGRDGPGPARPGGGGRTHALDPTAPPRQAPPRPAAAASHGNSAHTGTTPPLPPPASGSPPG